MKKILLILLFIVGSFTYSHAGIEFPADMPTITALINLHKKMAKAEDAYIEQQLVTDNATKFNDVEPP